MRLAVPMEHYWPTVPGGLWFLNAYAKLLDELPTDRPTVWVEVGVFHGQSLAFLGVEVINRNLPVTIHAVDTFEGWPGVAQGEPLFQSFLEHTKAMRDVLRERFVIHRRSSVDAAEWFSRASCDVVWLDADHQEAAVAADIAAWLPKVRTGGYIGGDDWAFGGVRHAVSKAFPTGYFLGEGERFQAPWPWWLVQK